MQLSNNKKEPATEHLNSAPHRQLLNHTNHRQGKKSSQNKPDSQALKLNNLAVKGLLYRTKHHVKRIS